MDLNDVEVDCVENRVVFARHYTLKFVESAVGAYRVARVVSGEAMTVNCPQSWRLFMKAGSRNGFLSIGDFDSGTPIMNFEIQPNGTPIWPETSFKGFPPDLMAYSPVPITSIDLSIVVRWKMPWTGLQLMKRLRFLTQENSEHKLTWKPVPDSTPIIETEGVTFTIQNFVAHRPV
jgi:hypothetical protein